VPVIVMLHGCRQSPADFARGTGMNALADRYGFLVVYPEQSRRHNLRRCWNWFQPANQLRDAGEPAVLAGITREVLESNLPVRPDPDRVYVAGLSAGGAMAATLAVTYPDLYAAAAVHSGVSYGAARSASAGLKAMREGAADPEQEAVVAHAAMGPRARVVPLLVVHGEEDRTVTPDNADHLVRQWLVLVRLASGGALRPDADAADWLRAGRAQGDVDYSVRRWTNRSGRPVVECWRVGGLGHAWSGGSTDGSFADPRGPRASAAMYQFFSQHRLHEKAPAGAPRRRPRGQLLRRLRRLRQHVLRRRRG
jgi:poly(hydroxyalkanoate) depolymerase family esterase